MAALAVLGMSRLDFDTSTESVLDRTDPAWGFYQRSLDLFGGDEIIVVALSSEGSYEKEALREVARLSELAQVLPGVRRVDSLSTFPIIRRVEEDQISLRPVLRRAEALDQASLARLAAIVAADRIALNHLASPDGKVLAVNVLLEGSSAASQAEILAKIRRNVDPMRAWVSGVPVFRTEVNFQTRADIMTFVPVTVGLIVLLLLLIFRSVNAPLISLASSGIGMLVALGAMGALGTPITISTMILPSILLALGSAYSMHVLCVSVGLRDSVELERRLGAVVEPIILSGLTTTIGFVALTLTRIDVVRQLGVFGGLGVLAVTASTVSLLPALLRLLPLPEGSPRLDAAVRGNLRSSLIRLARTRPGFVLGGWFLAVLGAAVGVVRLEVETDAVLWFPRGSEVRDSYEQIREKLSGISPMNVVIEGEDVTRPDVVNAIDRLSSRLESLPEVGKAISVADPLRQIHSVFSDGADAGLPGTVETVEQYLLILESVAYLGDVVSWNRRSANVLLRVDNNGSEDLIRIARDAENWWSRNGVEGFAARTTGIMHEFARSENELAWGQLRGLSFALAAIGGVLFAIFRWPLIAFIAIVPNVIPLFVVFGVMGLLGVPLDAVTVGLGSTALGIAVDDTIHLVARFRNYSGAAGSAFSAVDGGLREVLPPLVYTTLVVGGGFAALALSNFTVTQHLGLVTTGVVVLCLLADLTLLPVLLGRVSTGRLRRR